MKKILGVCLLCCISIVVFAQSNVVGQVKILAAENFYGDIASTIGGSNVNVVSILSSPSTDPHFPNIPNDLVTQINSANIVIENGAGYDSWMDAAYAKSNQKAILINVARLTNTGSAANPHIWYNPNTIPIFAKFLTGALSQIDPNDQSSYQVTLQGLLQMAQGYQAQVERLASMVRGQPVTATEPVCNALLNALGLKISNNAFQIALMNNIIPGSANTKEFEDSLVNHQVNLLIYNNQVSDSLTEHLKQVAKENNIPVVGVSELMPDGMHYYAWMYQTLFAIRDAMT